MSLLCRIFGHFKGDSYRDHYDLVGAKDWKDGIGRTHITVAKKCHNCRIYFDHKYVCLGVMPTTESEDATP